MGQNIMTNIFIDSSAYKALFDKQDDFYLKATTFMTSLPHEDTKLFTSNFILDETYTLIRSHFGKAKAISFRQYIVPVSLTDEAEAWNYFEKLPGRGVSFTDCTSFAVMKRLGIKQAFTFDEDFERAGFEVVPSS